MHDAGCETRSGRVWSGVVAFFQLMSGRAPGLWAQGSSVSLSAMSSWETPAFHHDRTLTPTLTVTPLSPFRVHPREPRTTNKCRAKHRVVDDTQIARNKRVKIQSDYGSYESLIWDLSIPFSKPKPASMLSIDIDQAVDIRKGYRLSPLTLQNHRHSLPSRLYKPSRQPLS